MSRWEILVNADRPRLGVLHAHLAATVKTQGLLAANDARCLPPDEISVLVGKLEFRACNHIRTPRPELLIVANRGRELLRTPSLINRLADCPAQDFPRGFGDRPFRLGIVYVLLAVPLLADQLGGAYACPLLRIGIHHVRDTVR